MKPLSKEAPASSPVSAANENTHRGSGSSDFGLPKQYRLTPRFFSSLYVVAEAIAVILTAIFAKLVYVDLLVKDVDGQQPYAGAALVLGGLTLIIFNFAGLANERDLLHRKASFADLVFWLSMPFLGTIAVLFLFEFAAEFSWIWMLLVFVASVAIIFAGRLATASIAMRLRQHGQLVRRIAVYGTPGLCQEVQGSFEQNDRFVECILFHDGDTNHRLQTLIELGKYDGFDAIIVALPRSNTHEMREAISQLSVLPLEIQIYEENARNSHRVYSVENLGELCLLTVCRRPLSEWQAVSKRLFDIVFGTVMLILLLPILPIIAFAIKRESKGAVFFFQRRHGLNHKVIWVWKFRTMSVTEDGVDIRQARLSGDSRVTRIGAFLRKTSIDELPQLINVVLGDMSLVGPRPHAVVHNHEFGLLIDKYANRHRVKPGITGLAQIRGYRGNTEDIELMRRRIESDMEYIETWSMWRDIRIIITTAVMSLDGSLAEKSFKPRNKVKAVQ